ncbi:MAG TPA: hypothetical protein DCY07_04480, partial [Rhodospirillaceae bacterium]|nr:hypothetical protein [Rhodospirillaceae bacterium]
MNQFRALALMSLAVFAVLDPLSAMAAQPQPAKPDNVLKLLESNKEFSKFADLIDDAGIESELTNKDSKVTVFAPTNAAMDKLPSDVLKRAKASKDGLKSLVRYHMINGSAVFATNIKGRRAGPSTANGEMVGFDGTGKELMVNQAVIVTPDQYAQNGVVHAINAPLIPESLKDPKIKEEARAKEESAMREQMAAQEEQRNKEMKSREKENATAKLEQKAAEEKVKAEADAKVKEEAEAKTQKEVKPETAPAAVKAPVVDSKTAPAAAPKTTEKAPVKTEAKPEAKPDAKATVKT